jgi:ribulose bisphosphate carboxylase small subunit
VRSIGRGLGCIFVGPQCAWQRQGCGTVGRTQLAALASILPRRQAPITPRYARLHAVVHDLERAVTASIISRPNQGPSESTMLR